MSFSYFEAKWYTKMRFLRRLIYFILFFYKKNPQIFYIFLHKMERVNELSINRKWIVFICIIYVQNKEKIVERWGTKFNSKKKNKIK